MNEEFIPENTCETIQITKDILQLFVELETEYIRIKEEIKQEIKEEINSLKPKSNGYDIG